MVTSTQPAEPETPRWTAADLAQAIQATSLTSAERATLVRAIRDSVPDLLHPDPSLSGKMRSAARLSAHFIDSAATGLENSELWQKSADATPEEIRQHLSRAADLTPLAEEAKALNAVMQFNTSYHHYIAATKSRVAYNVGRRLGGDEGRSLKPHLDIIKDQIPKTWRRKPKPTPTPAQ
jgi:hypothetical protein